MRRQVSMRTLWRTPALVLALAAALCAGATGSAQNDRPLNAEEIRALVERLRANQHHNDAALAEYERVERRIARKDDEKETITDDKTWRVVPTGTGTLKLILEEKGGPVSDDYYRKQLHELEKVLQDALKPQLGRQKKAIEKWANRSRERREMVDSVPEAFVFTWLGRERRNGRVLVKLQLDPRVDFKPRAKNAETFQHVRATVWLDEAEAQVVRVEAQIIKDISVFGGIFGKVYSGGTFVMEQIRVAEGVWLPSRYEFVFDGRKFLFPFSVNETSEASNYRRIGPPKEALVTVRREIQNGGVRPSTAKSVPANSK